MGQIPECVFCGRPDVDDGLTPDGLCFECGVEDVTVALTSDEFADMMLELKAALSGAPGHEKN